MAGKMIGRRSNDNSVLQQQGLSHDELVFSPLRVGHVTQVPMASRPPPLPVGYKSRWMVSKRGLMLIALVVCLPRCNSHPALSFDCHDVFKDLTDIQTCTFKQAEIRCNITISKVAKPSDGGAYCPPIWDKVMCWPSYVPAGKRVNQSCADYVDGFNAREKAFRYCTPAGHWEIHPDVKFNSSWTNFSNCRKKGSIVDPILEDNMPIVFTIAAIGYYISLAFLVVAIFIMLGFKKLLCQRNIIHVNLFMCFSLRAIVSLVRHGVLVDGFALPKDVMYGDDGSLIFLDGPHWECKLLTTLLDYSVSANYMWIFIEGLYLHNLVFFAVFWQSKQLFRFYIAAGWLCPLVFVGSWVIVRIYKNDTLCWNTHDNNYYWIMETPIILSIFVNFLFFLNIIRVLFLKIRDCNTQDPRRYRKLAKSTLVLIPLFGVYYIIFIILDKYRDLEVIVIIHLYTETVFNSLQGTVVSLLFCFCNGEVQAEFKKRWHRRLLRRQSVISGRSSRAFSTSSFLLRDRTSVSQAQLMSDLSRLSTNGTTPGTTPPRSPQNTHHQLTAGSAIKYHPGDISNRNVKRLSDMTAGGEMARTSSAPQWSESTNEKVPDLPRVASTSKVTFRLDDVIDVPKSLPNGSPTASTGSLVGNNNITSTSNSNNINNASLPNGSNKNKPSLYNGNMSNNRSSLSTANSSRSSLINGDDSKPLFSPSEGSGETIHLLSDNGTRAHVSNGFTPRVLPYPSSFRKGTSETNDSKKGEIRNGKQ